MEIVSEKQYTDLYSGRFDSGADTGKKHIQQKCGKKRRKTLVRD